jgi:hypothetical protein
VEICARSRDWKGIEFNLPHKTSCVSRLNKLTFSVTDNHMVTRAGVSTPSVLQNLTSSKESLLENYVIQMFRSVLSSSRFRVFLQTRI